MLIRLAIAEAIATGTIRVQYRRWAKRRVKAGTWIHTPAGVVVVDSITECDPESLTDDDARAAGEPSISALRKGFRGADGDPVWRVEVSFGGEDPRVGLRADDDLSDDDVAMVTTKLDRMDERADAPWAWRTLELIRERPAVLAADLGAVLGLERDVFKPRVRRLKALGLTESLKVGYRLSPRGEKLLDIRRSDR
ncbi:ASCH domain-containing protein [Rhodococcus sp. UNC23MFCrub1.1]|uniref:ASCH domain-containing protein n=1 Tax=Rhodococcus sp. UNC23MFCrub1.1 TaxID=1449068 RepID=UPI0004808CED|nr:ASCH domain-containing protein [Rhodococcus sp. UNC23MFCrub1.1]